MSFRQLEKDVVDCRRCTRLVEHREQVAATKKRAYRDCEYWGRPVPGFGDRRARVVLVGLAPAAHGANRTGRMFTGDGEDGMGSSDFLARSLCATGFANLPTSRHRGDGYELADAYMTTVARCAPPGNKLVRDEIVACRDFLARELGLLKRKRVIVALGKTAFDEIVQLLGDPRPRPKFGHGAVWDPGDGGPVVVSSYHPSRQNTQTRRLTQEMLDELLRDAKRRAEDA